VNPKIWFLNANCSKKLVKVVLKHEKFSCFSILFKKFSRYLVMRKNGVSVSNLKISILLPLFVVLVLIISGFVYIHDTQEKKYLKEYIGAQFLSAKQAFDAGIDADTRKFKSALTTLTSNIEIKDAMIAGDREALYKHSLALFNTLNIECDVTHFYFHQADRVNLLRMHQPERYGDKINRFSILKAESTGNPASALEIGPLGLFTLRVVFPWYDNEKLIGYVELGEEIEHLYKLIKNVADIDIFVLINKEVLSRKNWESGMKMLGRQAQWDLLPESVVSFSTLEINNSKSIENLSEAGDYENVTVKESGSEHIFRTHSLTLYDAGELEQKIGSMIFLRDISDIKEQNMNHFLFFIGTGILIGGLLFLFFFLLTRKIEQKLEDSRISLVKSESRFRSIVENSSDLIWEVDINARYTYLSPNIKELLGYEANERIGKSPFDFMPEDEAKSIAKKFAEILNERRPFTALENTNQHKDGHKVIMETNGLPIFDEEGLLSGYRGIDRDITERKRSEEKIKHMAYYDELTDLPNRTLFKDRLTQECHLADRNKSYVAILFMDIDHFKKINDTLGHMVGDMLIQEISKRLKEVIRASDTVARFGGDEFAIIIPHLKNVQGVDHVLKSIENSFTVPFKILEHELFVNFSIGYSYYPIDGNNIDLLLRNADTAMYHAKDNGRNYYQRYEFEMTQAVSRSLLIQNSLRQAIKNEELVLYYQPQVDLKTGVITGVEALIRWHHPEKGLVFPDMFIQIAEDSGLIVPMGEWIIRTACKQAKAWQDEGYLPIVMAINLSARQFKEAGFAKKVITTIHETGIDAKYIELELTESILVDNSTSVSKALDEFKNANISLSLDDFGTGYSSLSYLKLFPIDKLKIDQSFIRDMLLNKSNASLVRAIISMAKALGLKTIAEGVETKEQLNFLHEENCGEIQGYFISRPVPPELICEFMQKK
jgi:diguanylate cyclase (GGDEF)-like protein/PAS domain S-box-containing protein